MTRLPTLLAIAVLTLSAGCGDDDGDDTRAQPAPETVTVEAPPAETPPDDTSDDRDDGDSRDDDGEACERLDRMGPIDMAGAGRVTLNRSGGRLSVTGVRPNQGWRARVDRDDDGDEIEVDFVRGDREVQLEAEIDDGRLGVELCRKRR